ncbi:WD40-repeat-containing domain protein [Apiospora arundinis]
MGTFFDDPKVLDYDVIAIQEPWINSKEYNSYNPRAMDFTLWLPTPDKITGVAFYVNKRLDQSRISFTSHTSHLATLAISYDPVTTTTTTPNTLYIHNVYNNPSRDQPLSTLRELTNTFRSYRVADPKAAHLIVGDFNIESPAWAVEDLGDRGTARDGAPYLRDFLGAEGLEVVLPPGTYTRLENTSSSTIDLAICCRVAAVLLLECRRADEVHHDSDHRPIHTILQLQPPQAPPRPPQEALGEHAGGRVQDSISYPAAPATGPGFSAECKAKCRETNRFRRIWQRTRAPRDWEAYCESKNQKGTAVKKSLTEAWQERVNKACAEGPKGMWGLVKMSKSAGQGVQKQNVTPTIDTQTTFEGKIEALSKAFFPPPPDKPRTPPPKPEYEDFIPCPPLTRNEVAQAIFRPRPHKAPGPSGIPNHILRISMDLLMPLLHPLFNHCLFRGLCPFKDSITVVLKKPGKASYSTVKAFRPIALLETIGKALESALAERISYYVEHYSLLPQDHIGARKTRSTEHAIHVLLERIHEAHGAADEGEFQVATLLMLDASGAFDNVDHDKLVDCLARRGLPRPVVQWISNWLRDRRTKLKLPEGESDWILQNYGIPQGSSLSPLLWLFYNADLLDEILGEGSTAVNAGTAATGVAPGADGPQDSDSTSDGETPLPGSTRSYPLQGSSRLSTTAWVDDTGILVIGASAEANCRVLEKVHGRAAVWATKYGCVFAPQKYELMHFHTKRAPAPRAPTKKAAATGAPTGVGAPNQATAAPTGVGAPTTSPNGTPLKECIHIPGAAPIEPTQKLRHLGVWFDPGLLWDHHIHEITLKVRKSIQALSAISGAKWGCSTLQLRQLYQAIVVPQITYCSTVWYQPHVRVMREGRTKQHLTALRQLQTAALRVVTGGLPSSALLAMCAEMHVLPIEQQLLQANHMAYLRLRSNPLTAHYGISTSDTARRAHYRSPLTRLIEHHQQFHKTQPPLEIIVPFVVPPWWKQVTTVVPKGEKAGKAHHEYILKAFGSKSLVFYTDGSGYNGGVGAATYQPRQLTSRVERSETAYLGPSLSPRFTWLSYRVSTCH